MSAVELKYTCPGSGGRSNDAAPFGCYAEIRHVDLTEETKMAGMRSGLFMITGLLLSGSVALALQAGNPCASDIKKLCAGIQPGEGRIKVCIKTHLTDLSPSCEDRVLTVAMTGRLWASHAPCALHHAFRIGGGYVIHATGSDPMNRRVMLALLGNTVAGWPFAATAEDRLRVIGVLSGLAEGDPLTTFRVAAFSERLRQLGWVEGKNIRTVRRFSAGVPAKLPELARELIEARCEILLAEAAQAVDAARGATKTVPIVMIYVGDALGPGYIASLSHPGGNITGHTLVATDQAAKRLEYLKKVSPGIMRIAVISNLNASGHIFQRKELAIAGPALGIELQQLPMKTAEELDATLKAVIDGKAQATSPWKILWCSRCVRRSRILDAKTAFP
jgi:hypothetical protein